MEYVRNALSNVTIYNHNSHNNCLTTGYIHYLGPDFDDMSSFFLFEIDDAIQYINLEYGAQAPKIVIL